MNLSDPLLSTLLDVLATLDERGADVPLLLGGGYGLYLKQRHIRQSNARTLLSAVPAARSTDDLDLFLWTEVLADSVRLKPLREALDVLGFTVIPSARNYQFARRFTIEGRDWDVKIDLLTKAPDTNQFSNLEVDERRVKPRPSIGLHAHRTDEAIAIEEEAQPLEVSGTRTDGTAARGRVYLPQTYPFLMMKLFALRDQIDQAEKGYGRKHALDLYMLIALLTDDEYSGAKRLRDRYRTSPEATVAAHIVATLFATEEALGTLRLREHVNFPGEAMTGLTGVGDLQTFLEVLRELFPA